MSSSESISVRRCSKGKPVGTTYTVYWDWHPKTGEYSIERTP